MFDRPVGYQYFNELKLFLGGDLTPIFNGKLVYPRQLEIHLPGNHKIPCMFNCQHCQGRILDQPVVPYEEKALAILHQLKGDIPFHIYGGAYTEPLLNPFLIPFLETTKKYKSSFGIHTNGALLHKLNKRDNFATNLCLLATSNKDYLSISLDAGYKESHKLSKRTHRYWFQEIIEGIREVAAARSKLNSKLSLRICYLFNELNCSLDEVCNIIVLLDSIGCDSIKLSIPYEIYGKDFDEVKNYKASTESQFDDKYHSIVDKAINSVKPINLKVFYISPKSQDVAIMEQFRECIYSYFQITFGADGFIYKCSSAASPTFKFARLGAISDSIEEFNRAVLANHSKQFNPQVCFSNRARCNRMAFEINKEWNEINNLI